MRVLVFLSFVLINFISQFSLADYRVFILHLENTNTKITRQIQTTLDPDQYKMIYPLKQEEVLTYVRSWRCLGRTDFFKPHCQAPQ